MKNFVRPSYLLLLSFLSLAAGNITAQPGEIPSQGKDKPAVSKGLFDSDEVLEMTLSGNLRDLLRDRSEKPKYFRLAVSYKKADNDIITLPAQAKTRGHFRRLKENCSYPPLALKFSKSDLLKTSVFKNQDKLKLVMPCRGDEYVVREWLVGLVVKKGWKILSTMSWEIPTPLSSTSISIFSKLFFVLIVIIGSYDKEEPNKLFLFSFMA